MEDESTTSDYQLGQPSVLEPIIVPPENGELAQDDEEAEEGEHRLENNENELEPPELGLGGEGASCLNQNNHQEEGSIPQQQQQEDLLLSKEEAIYPIVIKAVCGYEERRNDIIYCPPDKSVSQDFSSTIVDGIEYGELGLGEEKVLVFFGGDIQDLQANMTKYLQYSLEATASLLHSQLPGHHILIIRPSLFKLGTYSSFDNFVPSPNTSGIPEHTANNNALKHLEALLRGVGARVSAGGSDEECGVSSTTGTVKVDLVGGRLSIVGFSKGCVVLNQLLYEFHFYKTLHPESPPAFINQIAHMFWLDGGHSGGKNTWIVSRPILDTLSRLNLSVHVHLTPYQLNDDRRPYIRNEEKVFSVILSKLGMEVDRSMWFENDEGSLENHFALIGKVFERRA